MIRRARKEETRDFGTDGGLLLNRIGTVSQYPHTRSNDDIAVVILQLLKLLK